MTAAAPAPGTASAPLVVPRPDDTRRSLVGRDQLLRPTDSGADLVLTSAPVDGSFADPRARAAQRIVSVPPHAQALRGGLVAPKISAQVAMDGAWPSLTPNPSVKVLAPTDNVGVGVESRAEITGPVPRMLAERLAAEDDLPIGDPVTMTFTVMRRDDAVWSELPEFRLGAQREQIYAYASSRDVLAALRALLQATPKSEVGRSSAAASAAGLLDRIDEIVSGPEPTDPGARMMYRAAHFAHARADAIADTTGTKYGLRLGPVMADAIDEPRERFVSEALHAAGADPALVYAIAADGGLEHAVASWHVGIAAIAVPSSIDAGETLGLRSITAEAGDLVRGGYLAQRAAETISEDGEVTTIRSSGATSALANGLAFIGAKLARAGEIAYASTRFAQPTAAEEAFLTLLAYTRGEEALTRYVRGHAGRAMLPSADEREGDAELARLYALTATWEQLTATGIFARWTG
jgi:hypothetical protein